VLFARRGDPGLDDLNGLLAMIGADLVPHTGEMARIAIEAFKQFGKGQGNSAKLNFCDCAAYALAKALDAPLLYKGGDFSGTDVKAWRWLRTPDS
jgi:ribonuclease VapC